MKIFKNKANNIIVEFPFTEERPTISSNCFRIFQEIHRALLSFSPVERAKILCTLCTIESAENELLRINIKKL